jgi:hypothetical protein
VKKSGQTRIVSISAFVGAVASAANTECRILLARDTLNGTKEGEGRGESGGTVYVEMAVCVCACEPRAVSFAEEMNCKRGSLHHTASLFFLFAVFVFCFLIDLPIDRFDEVVDVLRICAPHHQQQGFFVCVVACRVFISHKSGAELI